MCRLVGYAGAPVAPAVTVFGGSHSLLQQSYAPRELLTGTVNADGYAVTWYPDGKPVRVAGAEPIWQNPDLERLLASVEAPVVAGGVRNATPGIPPDPSGIAPLCQDRWTFALNGFVESFRARVMRAFHAGIPDALYGRMQGTSDTEALFLLALARLQRGADPEEAAAEVVQQASEVADELGMEAQLNLLLTAPNRLVVTRASNRDESNSLYVSEQARLAPEGCLVASEPLEEDGTWWRVPHDSVVAVGPDGRARVESL